MKKKIKENKKGVWAEEKKASKWFNKEKERDREGVSE